MRYLLLLLLAGCVTKKPTPTLEICTYDSTALLNNLHIANPPVSFAKGKPVKPPRGATSGYNCIYLDFDGETGTWPGWNGGQRLTLAPCAMTEDMRLQTLLEVAALFAPFKVVVTDSLTVFNKAGTKRAHIIITPTSAWYGGVSGIAFTGSVGQGIPGFVFSDRLYNGPHYIAEIVAHESSHIFGLRHQSEYNADCTLKLTYKMGVVMGNSLYVPQGAWINGTTYTCTTYQDDKAMLGTVLGYK